MIDEQIPECVVLEDDIFTGHMFKEVLRMRHHLPYDWDFINFCTDARQQPFGAFLTDIYRASNHLDPANRTSSYLIRLSGAKKLMRVAYPIRYEADGLTGRPHVSGLISYGVSPSVVALQDVDSDVWLPLGRRSDAPKKVSFRQKLKKILTLPFG
jgi:glycosyl transferase family 25